MSDHPNDPFDDLMRQALANEADRIEPADALPEIQARARAQRRPATRRPWVLTAGAAAIGTAAAIGAFAVLDDSAKTAGDDQLAGSPGTTTSATGAPSSTIPTTAPAPTPAPSAATQPPTSSPKTTAAPSVRGIPETVRSAAVPVYWLGEKVGTTTADPTVRLYRTWSKIVHGRPAFEAVRIMTSKDAGDPDYYSAWRGAQVSSVTRAGDVVTVDFKQLPQTELDEAAATIATQQLVYTVQGAMNNARDRVQVTQQGRAGGLLFGHIDTSRPFSRAEASKVQALVWIDNLTDGQVTKSPLTVTGIAAAFEGTVNWRATNLKTRATQADFTTTKEGQAFSPFAVPLKLQPGQWRIEAYLISDADGSISDTDSKTVFVK
ncbi:sporulation and spore germination protein [Kribbella steppae]|uniref:Sporulation and spore germination protein n=1 Tax=Kribbella steppae TaxID=2512223 RepID=A0A4R2HW65_9ACTN|nr:Gmad2 immunoglobulin-like domain-containing protein [Kribbella steppae]TCO35714.1 sporulation and spore germination protein [Kribbella steppae]